MVLGFFYAHFFYGVVLSATGSSIGVLKSRHFAVQGCDCPHNRTTLLQSGYSCCSSFLKSFWFRSVVNFIDPMVISDNAIMIFSRSFIL